MKHGKDASLRQAIHNTLHVINTTETKLDLYKHVLEELCELSGSPFGFALERAVSENGGTSLACHYALNKDSNRPQQDSSDLCNCLIPVGAEMSEFYRAINRNQPFVLVNSHLRAINKACHAWPTLKQVIALPMGQDHNACVVCLANATTPYHVDYATSVWPLLNICASFMQIVISKQQTQAQGNRSVEKDLWRQNFSELESFAPIGIIAADQNHRILRINPTAELMFGLNPHSIAYQEVSELIPNHFTSEQSDQLFNLPQTAESLAIRVSGKHSSGELFPLELSVMHYQEQDQTCQLLLLRDSTDLQKMQAQHRVELERFRTLSDLAPMGILQTDEH